MGRLIQGSCLGLGWTNHVGLTTLNKNQPNQHLWFGPFTAPILDKLANVTFQNFCDLQNNSLRSFENIQKSDIIRPTHTQTFEKPPQERLINYLLRQFTSFFCVKLQSNNIPSTTFCESRMCGLKSGPMSS